MKRRLAIQHVHIHWDKATRGMPGSAVRNALPRALPFRAPYESDAGWVHRIDYSARENFAAKEAWHDLDTPDGWRVPVSTLIDGDHLKLRFDVQIGQPARPHLTGWVARLPFGRRLIFRVNAKVDGDHDRWYFEDVLHIGWAEQATLDLPLFREIDERVLLY